MVFVNLEFGGHIRSGDINLGEIILQMTFKGKKLNDITYRMNLDQGEK